MKTIKSFFSKVAAFFSSPKAQQALDTAADMTALALPYIAMVAPFATGVIPGTLDDAALAFLKARYPRLFDGSIHNGEELKLYAFASAADLLKQRYPAISTSIARLAVSAAYLGNHA